LFRPSFSQNGTVNCVTPKARRAVAVRIERLQAWNFGDWASIGDSVSELRLHFGPGYRLYYTIRNQEIVILLCGGIKSNQRRDMERAKAMAVEILRNQ
jgi:putative addiction module killer protein